jgi:hypothetical protein
VFRYIVSSPCLSFPFPALSCFVVLSACILPDLRESNICPLLSSKVGDPQISSANHKSANFLSLIVFLRFADLPQMWYLADVLTHSCCDMRICNVSIRDLQSQAFCVLKTTANSANLAWSNSKLYKDKKWSILKKCACLRFADKS